MMGATSGAGTGFSGVRVAQSLVSFVVFCRSLFYFWPLCCPSFSFDHCVVRPFLLTIVLSVLFFWPLCCPSFSIKGFWLHFWYLSNSSYKTYYLISRYIIYRLYIATHPSPVIILICIHVLNCVCKSLSVRIKMF
jgi:hypothetical protein